MRFCNNNGVGVERRQDVLSDEQLRAILQEVTAAKKLYMMNIRRVEDGMQLSFNTEPQIPLEQRSPEVLR